MEMIYDIFNGSKANVAERTRHVTRQKELKLFSSVLYLRIITGTKRNTNQVVSKDNYLKITEIAF